MVCSLVGLVIYKHVKTKDTVSKRANLCVYGMAVLWSVGVITWHLGGLYHLQDVSDIQPGEGRKNRVQSPQHGWGLFRWIHRSCLHFIMKAKADYLPLSRVFSVGRTLSNKKLKLATEKGLEKNVRVVT